MSYSIQTNCYSCKKAKECTDHIKLVNGVNEMYKDENHKGSGIILLSCSKCESMTK